METNVSHAKRMRKTYVASLSGGGKAIEYTDDWSPIAHPRARRLDRSEADLVEERHEAGIVVERGEHGLESGVLQSGVALQSTAAIACPLDEKIVDAQAS